MLTHYPEDLTMISVVDDFSYVGLDKGKES